MTDKRKYEGFSCENCKGCYRQRDPRFIGRVCCPEIERPQPKVWCGDESVELFRRTGSVRGVMAT